MKAKRIGKWSKSEVNFFIGYLLHWDISMDAIDECLEEFLLNYNDDFELTTEAREAFFVGLPDSYKMDVSDIHLIDCKKFSKDRKNCLKCDNKYNITYCMGM